MTLKWFIGELIMVFNGKKALSCLTDTLVFKKGENCIPSSILVLLC